jgi:mono/diheme cytochrome c family protein
MKRFPAKPVHYIMRIAILGLFMPGLLVAESGRDLFRDRCADCHGKNGQGNRKMKAPSLTSSTVKNLSDDDLKRLISQRANGEMERKSSHTLLKQRLTADQVDAVIAYIRTVQSK